MALSGSLTAGYWYSDSGQSRGYTLSWSATQSVANNQSTISWWVDTAGTYPYTVAERTLTVTLAGQTLINKTDRVMRGTGRVASGSFTVTHDSAGNKSISGSITAAVYTSAVNCSNSTSWSLNTIARQANISTAPNFNDEGNPAITYSNPAGSAVTSLDACISLTGSKDDIAYRAISKTGTSYTFSLTEAERNVLRNACTTANSRTVKFFVRTVVGGTTFYSTLDRTLSIVNANPTFTATAEDTASASTELTGDSSTMIKGFNNIAASITAAAYKGATISSYKITNGGSVVNSATAAFSNTENNTFAFEVTDSRGNTASSSITLDMIPYVPLTCNVDGKVILSASDSTKAELTFEISGNYYNGSFGAVANTLTLAFTKEDSSGGWTYEELSLDDATFDGNTYKITKTIPDLVYTNSYVIIGQVSDKITSNLKSTSKTLKATPIFDWGENDFAFNVPISIQGYPVADYIVESGVDDFWYYEKWYSGKAVCYGKKNYGTLATTAWGNMFETTNLTADFPSGLFIENPQYIGAILLYGGAGGWIERGYSTPSTTSTGAFTIVRATNLSFSNATVGFHVIGRWK